MKMNEEKCDIKGGKQTTTYNIQIHIGAEMTLFVFLDFQLKIMFVQAILYVFTVYTYVFYSHAYDYLHILNSCGCCIMYRPSSEQHTAYTLLNEFLQGESESAKASLASIEI